MKYCSECNTPAFDNQKYCQKCGNKFKESSKDLKIKNKAENIFQTLKTRAITFFKNYKHFKTLPKKSKVKHVAFPIIALMIFAIVVNGLSGTDTTATKTIKDTNQHNDGVVSTYCDGKRAFFNFTYAQFVEQFNSKIAPKYPELSPLHENSALTSFSGLTITCLIGQKSLYSQLNENIVLCTVCDLRTSEERSAFDSNVAGIYILANKDKCDLKEISSLYSDILKIVNPNYSEQEINDYTQKIVPLSFSEVDDTEFFDENIHFTNAKMENCDYSVFCFGASQSQELEKQLENYKTVDCSDSQLKQAVEILKSNDVKNAVGASNNLYYAVCGALGGNPKITGTVDYYGNINVHFRGTYKKQISGHVIYKVNIEYGECTFLDSNLNWDYVMSTYKIDY